jgi:hypothetical protein
MSSEREVFLQQQLISKDAMLGEIIGAKDAIIASKDVIIAELRESRAATESTNAVIAQLTKVHAKRDEIATRTEALLAQQAQQLPAAEARLRQLEAASSGSIIKRTGSTSSSSSSSHTDALVQLQKRARSSPHLAQALDKNEVLDEIFSFVGRKELLYAGAVCRRWRGRYLSMCYKARASKAEPVYQTSNRSTFATAARFSLALDNGLTMPDESQAGFFFDDLPLFSQQPIEVLTLARVHGAAWHRNLCCDAAFCGHFGLLEWLHKSGCPWTPLFVAVNAIRSTQGQHELILPWLLSIVDEWSQADKNTLLAEAGVQNDLKAAELLLAKGAQWPDSFAGQRHLRDRIVRTCWRYDIVAWALCMGYCWGGWRCQDLAPELYSDEDSKADAVELFE